MRRSLRAHSIFIGIILAHALAAVILPPICGATVPYSPLTYVSTIVTLTGLAAGVFVIFYSVAVVIAVRPKRLWAHLGQELSEKVFTVERLSLALPTLFFF